MKYVINDVKKLERFYTSLVKKMEKIGNKPIKTYNEIEKLNDLCDLVDVLEPFFSNERNYLIT